MVEQGYVDLVVIPRGFFPYNTMIPQSRDPEISKELHYIFLTANNVKEYRKSFRQLIVPLPIDPEHFPN